MDEISKKIFEEIQKKKVAMTPKWHFVFFKFLTFFLLFLIFLLIVTIFSLISHLILHFELSEITRKNFDIQAVIHSLPYFWFLILGIAIVLWILEFFKTSYGYKIKIGFLVPSFLLTAFVFGLGFHFFGAGDYAEKFMETNFSFYGKVVKTPKDFWLQPEKGFLSGKIVSRDEEAKSLILKDWDGENWEVDYAKAIMAKGVELKSKKSIKVIGKEDGKNQFEAEEIGAWASGRFEDSMEGAE
jgi:hypothetical protein